MEFTDIQMTGYYKTSLIYKIIGKQKREDVEVFTCVDIDGNQFFIEGSDMFTKYTRNSSTYTKTVEETLTEIIHKLVNTKSIYEITFTKLNGDVRVIRGYTVGVNEELAYTEIYDLDKKGIRNCNNRGIQKICLNNTLYIVK